MIVPLLKMIEEASKSDINWQQVFWGQLLAGIVIIRHLYKFHLPAGRGAAAPFYFYLRAKNPARQGGDEGATSNVAGTFDVPSKAETNMRMDFESAS